MRRRGLVLLAAAGQAKPPRRRAAIASAYREINRHWYGRLAIWFIIVGLIGLLAHMWLGFLLVTAIPLPSRRRGAVR